MQKQEATVNCCTGIQQTSSPNAVVFTLPIPGQGLHQDEDTIYCGGCGERLDHGNSFCANCGTKSTSSVPCFAPAASPLVVSPIPTCQMPYTLLPERCSERPSTQHLHYIPLPQGPRWEAVGADGGLFGNPVFCRPLHKVHPVGVVPNESSRGLRARLYPRRAR